MSTLFIADLHLSNKEPEIYQRFKTFLKDKARNARALYILGDLFEYYLGDDAISGVAIDVRNDLKELVEKHKTSCYFMAGNRDFLLGDDFAERAHIKILNDPVLIELDDKKVILTHADKLCTDDAQYQTIRKQLRSSDWQANFLSQSIQERIAFAKQARTQSQQHTQSMDTEIMDVNAQAVVELFQKFNTHFMIHGHTHRPAFHQDEIDGKIHYRMVLGDWHYQISFIEYKNNDFQLVTC